MCRFGFKGIKTDEEVLTRPWFKWLLVVEMALCFAIVALLALYQPNHWLLACWAAFLATAPDLYSFPRFLAANKIGQGRVQSNAFRRFHSAIQTERPWGAVIEVAWLGVIGSLFVHLLAR